MAGDNNGANDYVTIKSVKKTLCHLYNIDAMIETIYIWLMLQSR